MKARRVREWWIVLGDAAAWAWPSSPAPVTPRRFAADAEGHAALLRCLGEGHGEARSRVLLDLGGETLHQQHVPTLRWRDRRALAQQCRRNLYAADALVGWRWRPEPTGGAWLQLCGVPMQGPLPAWLHLLAHSAAPPVALYSASWLGERLAHAIGASHGPVLLLQPGLDGARLSWLHNGRVCASRQIGSDGADVGRVLDFFASHPEYPTHGVPTLWRIDHDDPLANHPAWLAFPSQLVPLILPGLGWADCLLGLLARQPGEYRWPASSRGPRLGQCPPHWRRRALAASLVVALLGVGCFAYGELLAHRATQLAADAQAVRHHSQQLATRLGPLAQQDSQRATLASLLTLHTRWPRLGEDLASLTAGLAKAPTLQLQALHWRANPVRLGLGHGAQVQLELRPDIASSPRQALAELEPLLADWRRAGWEVQLSDTPFDLHADATLLSQPDSAARVLVQLSLPARGMR